MKTVREWALNNIVVVASDDIFLTGDRRNTIGWADLSNSVDIDGSSNYANNIGRIEGHNAIIEVSNPKIGYQWPVTNSGDSNKFMDFGGAIQFFVDKVNNHLYVRFADSTDMSNWGAIVTENDFILETYTSPVITMESLKYGEFDTNISHTKAGYSIVSMFTEHAGSDAILTTLHLLDNVIRCTYYNVATITQNQSVTVKVLWKKN